MAIIVAVNDFSIVILIFDILILAPLIRGQIKSLIMQINGL